MSEKYLFDTYALICLIQDRASYRRFADSIIITTQYNLIELYYSVLQEYGETTAKDVYLRYKNCLVSVTDDVIYKAMALRLRMKRKNPKCNLSYVDCIGYECAKSLKIPFVTGDKEFKDMDDVVFVDSGSDRK